MRFVRWLFDQPYLLLVLTTLFWAGNSIVGRAIVGKVPPVALAEIRWILASAILLPFAFREIVRHWPILRRDLGVLTVISATGITAFNTLLYFGLERTTATNATLMQSCAPLLIGLWSFVLFRDALTGRQLAGIAISLAGVAAIVSGGDPARLLELSFNTGDLIALLAIAFYGLYSSLLRRRPKVPQLVFVTFTVAWGATLLLPFFIVEYASGARMAPLDLQMVATIVYLAVCPSVLSYLFFNRGVELIGANRAGPFFHLTPCFVVVMAVIFLGEEPAIHHAIGFALILTGVWIASRRPPARPSDPAAVKNRVAPEAPLN